MNTHPPGEQVWNSKQALEMLVVANDFCLFIEQSADYSLDEILGYLQKALPAIYLKASLLPYLQPEDENAVEHYVTEEQCEAVYAVLRTCLGDGDTYYYNDLYEKSHQDPVMGSISENMADLYQDLRDFVLLFQNPIHTFRENAVLECRTLFEHRFGYSILNSLRAIHCLLHRKETGEDFPEFGNPV